MTARKNLILFTGDSSATLRKNLSAWMDSFAEKYGETNVAKLRAQETEPPSAISELLSMPFFSEKRLVVFEGIPRGKAGMARDDGDVSSENSDALANLEAAILSVFDSIPDSTFAIFVSEAPNANSPLYKKLVSECDVKTFSGLTPDSAQDYVRDRLPGITPRALKILLERTAKNPDRKKNEALETDDRRLRTSVEKLSLGFGENRIDEKEIEEAEPQTSNQKAYLLGDRLLSGDLEGTISMLRMLLEKDSAYAIFPSIVSTVRRTLHIELLRKNGKTDTEISELTGYSAYSVKFAKRLRDGEKRAAEAAYAALVKFETDWRTGNAPGEDESDQLETGVTRAALAWEKATDEKGRVR